MLLGADRKPVMRKDRSRVAFYLRDAARLAKELAPSDDPDAPDSDPVPLAPLDSGYNRDWDPQAFKSWLADITKITKLLAYDYVRFTEPQEAVRRAVSDILQNPTYVKERHIHAWAPGKYDIEAVKFVAATLRKRAVGPEVAEGDVGVMGVAGTTPSGGLPGGSDLGAKLVKGSATSNPANPASEEVLANQSNPTMAAEQVAQNQPQDDEEDPIATELETAMNERRTPIIDGEPYAQNTFGRGGPTRREGDPIRGEITRNIQLDPPARQPRSVINTLRLRTLTDLWRNTLGSDFETRGRPYDGYGTYLIDNTGFALGRYQMRLGSLIDAGMMDRDQNWTGKFGIYNWQEFLNNPQAQEAALVAWTERMDRSIQTTHARRLGEVIIGIRANITVTDSGLAAAIHKQGSTGVARYFNWIQDRDFNTKDYQKDLDKLPEETKAAFLSIETRLRVFQNVPYRQQR